MHPDETQTATVDSGPAQSGEDPSLPGPHLDAGTTLGRYVVLYRVGSGGMGVIYAAYDGQLDRKVALKVLRSDLDSPARRDLLRREAKAMARLRHPNVVRVYDVGEDDAGIFLAMEFLEGPTLRHWIMQRRSWREVLAVFLEAGRGLRAAHEAGLVHQDFKPSNVMLAASGHAQVTDFGLARSRDSTAEVRGGSGSGFGTPAYLAPERSEGRDVDALSDQFSYCAALYQALFGHLPYDGKDPKSYAEEARSERIRPPNPGHRVPQQVRRALHRGLRADPALRYPSMAELLQELSDVLQTSARRKRLLLVAAAAVLAAISTYIVFAPQPVSCGGAEERIETVWNDARRGQLRAALTSGERPINEVALGSVERELDRYTEAWADQYLDACKATHVRHEQSERTLDLRMWCLDDRLVELGAFVDVVSRGGDEVALRAAPAVTSLRSLTRCADRDALDRVRLPDLDTVEQSEIDEARKVIDTQFAVLRTGGRVDLDVVEQALASARQHGHSPLEARAAQLASHVVERQEGDMEVAENLLRAAIRAATAAGDQPFLVVLYAQLGEFLGINQGRWEESPLWFDFGEATLQSLGPGHLEEEQVLHHAQGIVAMQAGDRETAVAKLRRSHQLAQSLWPPDSPRHASAMADLGLALADDGDREGAVGLLRDAVDLRKKAFGPSNPDLAHTVVTLASLQADLGRYEPAIENAQWAHEVLANFFGPDHWMTGYPGLLKAQIYLALDRPGDVDPLLEAAERAFVASLGQDHPVMAEAWLARAERALFDLRIDEAEAALARALQIDLPETYHTWPARELVRGRLLFEQKDLQGSARALRRARNAFNPSTTSTIAGIWMHNLEGELALREGRLEDAETAFRTALDRAQGHPPHLAAESRFGLARTVVHLDAEKAHQLAIQSRAALKHGSSRTQRLGDSVERWLTARSPE